MLLLGYMYIYNLYIAYNVVRLVSVVKFCKLATSKIPYGYKSTNKKGDFKKSKSKKMVRP